MAKKKEIEYTQEANGCIITFGKTELTTTLKAEIKKKPNGFFYALIQTIYLPSEYNEMSAYCWETKREQFKIVNKDGEILKDFHTWALIMGVDMIMRVDELVTTNYIIKLLNKIK